MTDTEQKALFKAYQEGSEESFGILYSFFAPKLIQYLIRRTSLTYEEAEDLIQIVFIKINRFKHYYNPLNNSQFTTWVHTIVLNEYRNQVKAKKKRPHVSIDELAENNGEQDTEVGVLLGHHNIQVDLLSYKINKAIKALPSKLRPHARYFIKGWNHTETAKKLRRPLGTIKSQRHRAKKQLQESLRDRTWTQTTVNLPMEKILQQIEKRQSD